MKSNDWGVIGEKKLESGKKRVIFKVFCSFCGHFCVYITGSDSVIRWFESSYPSQKGQIWAKTGSDLLFFCILAEKDAVFECSMLGIGK